MAAKPTRPNMTALLLSWNEGNREALGEIVSLLYEQLRSLAVAQMRREHRQPLLQPTALVHEAYLKMLEPQRPGVRNRLHFFAIAASIMRRLLIDYARTATAAKRGGGLTMQLEDHQAAAPAVLDREQILSLEAALEALAALDARKAQVVELKYYGGLSIEEIATHLQVSRATIERDWTLAKAWLHRRLARLEP